MLDSSIINFKSAIFALLEPQGLLVEHFSSLSCLKNRFNLISIGKASAGMYCAIADIAKERIKNHLVIFPKNQPSSFEIPNLILGNHPIPQEESFIAGQKAISFIEDNNNLPLLALISGGTSSLICAPASNISESDIIKANTFLIKSGLSITQINIVRRHLSKIKGGNLLLKAQQKNQQVIVLAISDVPNGNPWDIGSGPFSPDPTTFSNALQIAQTINDFPKSCLEYLTRGSQNKTPENPSPTEIDSNNYYFKNIFDQNVATQKIEQSFPNAQSIPLPKLNSIITTGNLSQLTPGRWYFAIGENEIQVTSPNPGNGGRISHWLCESSLKLAKNSQPFELMAIATDGNDGYSNSSGGYLSSKNITKETQIEISNALSRYDTGTYLTQKGLLFPSTETQTNIGDIYLLKPL
jgi:glycerate-2-kinase